MENIALQLGAGPLGNNGGFSTVNPHYLGHVVNLSETHQVIASDNINDDSGIKLWAKGFPISRSLHAKLLRRRLSRPLEASLSIEGGASMQNIVADALARIDENAIFSALAGSRDARGLLRDMQKISLPGPVKLLLTAARESKQATYSHSLATVIVCAGLASHLQFSAYDASMLIVAALVHDIGEMYVNPEYLDGSKHLSPAEWKQVASHPCVGHQFIREFTNFPQAVAAGVLHHHERLDGSGYPFQVGSNVLGRVGAILGIADSVSAIVLAGGSGIRTRLEVALRIVPEEFDRKATSVVNIALRGVPEETCDEGQDNCVGRIAPVLQQLANAEAVAGALVTANQSAAVNAVGHYALSVLGNIEKSVRATGAFEHTQLAAIETDQQVIGEICLIVREVSWRLRNLARNLHLRIEKTGNPGDMERVAELIATLDAPLAGNS